MGMDRLQGELKFRSATRRLSEMVRTTRIASSRACRWILLLNDRCGNLNDHRVEVTNHNWTIRGTRKVNAVAAISAAVSLIAGFNTFLAMCPATPRLPKCHSLVR